MKPTRGGMARARVSALAFAFAAAVAACGGETKTVQVTPRRVAVASFVGHVDAATGTMTITPTGDDPVPMGLSFESGRTAIPVHQNGSWGDVDEGAVEMRTVANSWHTYANGCYPSTNMFQADVEIHSGFRAHGLTRILVEITYIDGGFNSCLSVPANSQDASILAIYGLFAYPEITAAQGSSTATWSFGLPNGLDFRFEGKVWAELVELTAPTTTSSLASGTYTAAQPMVLTCTDNAGGDGCANTYYSVDGVSTTYTAPFYPSGTHTICYWSDDLRGNAESEHHCGSYTVTAPAETAQYDATLGVPRCATFGSSCDTGATLVLSRGNVSGTVESHAPNTLGGTCGDGATEGETYGSTPSVDRITLSTASGGPFAPGAAVTLAAVVTARSAAETMDVFWASTTASPSWTLLGSVAATAAGQQTLTLSFDLPAGVAAVRTHFGPALTVGSNCGVSGYDDQDDLVFLPATTPHGSAAPTVSMSAPTPNNGARIEGSVLLTATASDDQEVKSVEFFWRDVGAGGLWNSIGVDRSPPWATVFDTVTTRFDSNALAFYARATDNDGNQTDTSASPVNSTMMEIPAIPTMTAPTDGAGPYSRAAPITLTATASKPHAIAAIDFFADGYWISRLGARLVDCTGVSVPCTSGNTESPYTYAWTPGATWSTTIPHKIYARALDFGGVTGQSAWVSVSFSN